MDKQKESSFVNRINARPRSRDTANKIIQVAGGNAAFGDMLRQMMWTSYCDAGQPFGATEEGMYIWIEHQQQTTAQ